MVFGNKRGTKSWAPAGGSSYPESGLVKPPRRETRALSPAGMFGGKAPLRLAAQKIKPAARANRAYAQYALRLLTFFVNGEYELD